MIGDCIYWFGIANWCVFILRWIKIKANPNSKLLAHNSHKANLSCGWPREQKPKKRFVWICFVCIGYGVSYIYIDYRDVSFHSRFELCVFCSFKLDSMSCVRCAMCVYPYCLAISTVYLNTKYIKLLGSVYSLFQTVLRCMCNCILCIVHPVQ